MAFNPLTDGTTVREFCDTFNSGIYLVFCGRSKEKVSHIVCCINGDWYDSWDSGSCWVFSTYEVR